MKLTRIWNEPTSKLRHYAWRFRCCWSEIRERILRCSRIAKASSAPLSSERAVRSLQISSGPSYFTFVRIHECRRRSSSLLISRLSHNVLANNLPLLPLPIYIFPPSFSSISRRTWGIFVRPRWWLTGHHALSQHACLSLDNTNLYIHARAWHLPVFSFFNLFFYPRKSLRVSNITYRVPQ